jgi:PKD domain
MRTPLCRRFSGIAGAFALLLLAACGSGVETVENPVGNRPPIVNAGTDQDVAAGSDVTLDGSGSGDPDGDALTYAWVQLSGPAVSLDSASTSVTGFVAPNVAAGTTETLVFQLTASDGELNQADTVTVIVAENAPPTVDAGEDQTVFEGANVTLAGTATDPNGDALSYQWTQTSGPAVVLDSPTAASTGFVAPDVAAGAPQTLIFQLTVDDGQSAQADTVTVTVEEQGSATGISGRVNYEFVPPNPQCRGLNFAATLVKPIRGATVQLLNAGTSTVIASTVSDDTGAYSFTGIGAGIDVRLRVRAELKRSGTAGWDVEVRDNTSNTGSQLASRPLYVMDGASFSTGAANPTQNLTASTGWNGAAYTGDRAAAPFAILDAIYSAMQLVTSVDPDAVLSPLDAFWSVNNTIVDGDVGAGEIGTSFYISVPNPSLFLLGDADSDTEEFDDHIVVHEWGHYFEDTFSRSDSIGGRHILGESLDPRLAFGEGFATALAAIALDEPLYCDTGAPGTNAGFSIDAESDDPGLQGWYNEVSVVTLIYDLWDTANDGTDNGSIGFGPIYETMAGPQATTPAFTSIFSFAAELRPMLDAAGQALLDAQLSRENIDSGNITIWGDGETNNADNPDVLPVYVDVAGDGSVTNVCTTSEFEPHTAMGDILERNGNKLSEQRFLRLTVPATGQYNVLVETTTPTPATPDPDDEDQSDPDIFIYRNGAIVASGLTGAPRLETFTTDTLLQSSEVYAVELEEFRYNDDFTPDSYPERVCFDVSFTLAP